jgi:magnesium transporter
LELVEAFVSQLVGQPVELATNGSSFRIGRVADIGIAQTTESFPPVTGVYVKTSDGTLRYAPFSSVRAVTQRSIVLNSAPVDPDKAAIPADELLLNKDLQDKQIVDVDGRKVVRVNDLKLAPAGDLLRLVAADVSVAGILRRLGFTTWGRRVLDRATSGGRQTLISWDAVQPLAHDPAEPVRLRVSQGKLERIHPSDLAAIIGELNVSDQASLMESLDEKLAAEAMEQLPEETQLSLIEDLKRDRAADIMERMDPDDAADLLAEVDPDTRADLLQRMEPEEAHDVRELLSHDEETAGGLMTTDFLSLPPGLTVADAFAHIRSAAEDAELVYYIYVLNGEDHILGVLSLRDMIRAAPDTPIAKIMNDDVVTVPLTASREEVATTIARYDLMAVPIVDKAGSMQGIVTVDDAVDILLPAKLRKMFPRVGKSRSTARTRSG